MIRSFVSTLCDYGLGSYLPHRLLDSASESPVAGAVTSTPSAPSTTGAPPVQIKKGECDNHSSRFQTVRKLAARAVYCLHPVKYMIMAERLNRWLEAKTVSHLRQSGVLGSAPRSSVRHKVQAGLRKRKRSSLYQRSAAQLKKLAHLACYNRVTSYSLYFGVKLYTTLSRVLMQEAVECVSITAFADYLAARGTNPVPGDYYTHGDITRLSVAYGWPVTNYAYSQPAFDRSWFSSHQDWVNAEVNDMTRKQLAIKGRFGAIKLMHGVLNW